MQSRMASVRQSFNNVEKWAGPESALLSFYSLILPEDTQGGKRRWPYLRAPQLPNLLDESHREWLASRLRNFFLPRDLSWPIFSPSTYIEW